VYIEKFQIHNYKSFLDSGPVQLSSGMNIVTGQNNVGKTALLNAISANWKSAPHRSIKTLPSPRSGFDRNSRVDISVTLSRDELLGLLATRDKGEICLPLPPFGAVIRGLNVAASAHPNRPMVKSVDMNSFVKWFSSFEKYTFALSLNGQGENTSWALATFPSFGFYEAPKQQIPYAVCKIDQDHTIQFVTERVINDASIEIGFVVARRLSELIYRFNAERFNTGRSGFGARRNLLPQATNLPEVLGTLQANPVAMERFNDEVRDILPQVSLVSIEPDAEGQQNILVWTDDAYRNGRADLAFPLNDSGTGIGQVLAIVYVVQQSRDPQVILIDEPQSFLHPGAARKLIEVLKRHPEHQYVIATHSPTIITAAHPETIILITHDGRESRIERLDSDNTDQLRRYLNEIGASLADVFGADGIIWVEGLTEEICFPMIIEAILNRPLMGNVVKGVIATGDLEGRHAERFFEIYNRLSGAQYLMPPAITFIFDDEGRTPPEKRALETLGKGRVRFTNTRMYENCLLDTKAITTVLNTTDGHQRQVSEADVQTCIEESAQDQKYFNPLEISRGLDWIRANLLLKDLFWKLGTLDYRKTKHSVELTRWLIDNRSEKLRSVAETIGEALSKT